MHRLRLLFTLIAAVFAGLGALAIQSEAHTGAGRRVGIVTLLGADAVALGQVFLVIATLGVVVWVPRRLMGPALALWWLALMAAIAWLVFARR
jgi:hypothetical protein